MTCCSVGTDQILNILGTNYVPYDAFRAQNIIIRYNSVKGFRFPQLSILFLE